MTALAPATRADAGARAASPYRLTFANLLRSEWIKITTLRSTWWSLGITAVLSIGISMMIASASAQFGGGFPAVSAILSPTQFTMLVAGILGAIVITGEYSTGMIRSTLTAEPRRGAVAQDEPEAEADEGEDHHREHAERERHDRLRGFRPVDPLGEKRGGRRACRSSSPPSRAPTSP